MAWKRDGARAYAVKRGKSLGNKWKRVKFSRSFGKQADARGSVKELVVTLFKASKRVKISVFFFGNATK